MRNFYMENTGETNQYELVKQLEIKASDHEIVFSIRKASQTQTGFLHLLTKQFGFIGKIR